MSVALTDLLKAADQTLKPWLFKDYCPNGLQVEGKPVINKLVSGVTACQALIDAAIEANADAIFVHHGYFWKGEDERIAGMKYRRIASLIKNDISLLAYHLPLDAHPEFGNNAQLARRLGIAVTGGMDGSEFPVGNIGELAQPVSPQAFADVVAEALGRKPLLEAVVMAEGQSAKPVKTVAWCSGGAQGYLQKAAALGADLYLTGEASEQTIHEARELGIHFIAAGHHATERYGAPALAAELAGQFGIEHQFIDIDNPV